ncbi:photosynthetic complex putative assembly protein PuhB [Phaeobacter sp.]|uniref:photosynthetic complex putative assembly protein PuhB n=1 Tax=Phaeobacter sp. TaxID=1902409 RepID=UPI0025F41DA3|nr:photosynthetic complex putative assembly protein PuhB [Phaeobacter sp.]
MEHSDFKTEPVPGLPEKLPEGEHILWQGAPKPWQLATEAMWLNWVIGYFAVLCLWRVVLSLQIMPWDAALLTGLPPLVLGGLATVVIYGMARLQARATLYTVTNQRVVMRIGAALTLSINLPFNRIAAADLLARSNGTGTIVFESISETRISYAMLWPHVQPWQMRQPKPALRCIPEAHHVAGLLAEAVDATIATPQVERNVPQEGALA